VGETGQITRAMTARIATTSTMPTTRKRMFLLIKNASLKITLSRERCEIYVEEMMDFSKVG
jgi:hypothetical protein